MKERGILFSAPMVRALLAGQKTQTRRLVKPQPAKWNGLQTMWGTSPPPNPVAFGEPGLWREVGPDYPDSEEDDRRCPYGIVGDHLWVRETWARRLDEDGVKIAELNGRWAWYWADPQTANTGCAGAAGKKRPAIHMPRWASRITLEVSEVRAQRLQNISEEDARSEGLDPIKEKVPTARDAYRLLWDDIHAIGSWASNPWVWAITFRRVQP